MAGKYKVRNDRILFVDFELTCWEGEPPPGQSMEIIEVGIAELDVESLTVTRSASLLVRPELSEVSAYCEELTGHSAQKLRKQGRPFAEVAASLRKNWGSTSKAWMAWGADRAAMELDCMRKDVANPFSEAFHNIGQQFTLLAGSSAAVGLTDGMRMLGLEREGRVHSGEDDAVQAARAWVAIAKLARQSFAPGLRTPLERDPG